MVCVLAVQRKLSVVLSVNLRYRCWCSKFTLIDEPIRCDWCWPTRTAEPTASMAVDIGGGTTEVAVISLKRCFTHLLFVSVVTVSFEAIINYVRRNYGSLTW
ncbi:rod shape-determining protein [Vibrio chagasii]|nr:rod shape-determining protein [Vibrio chagasii]